MNEEINDFASSASKLGESSKNAGWERATLEKLVFANLNEQRAKRRWNIFFRLAFLSLFAFIAFKLSDFENTASDSSGNLHTAVIKIDGPIEADAAGAAAVVIPALNRAFADDDAVGVILEINSPGGSPVQAGMINDELRRLRKLYSKKPVYVVVDEMCASAAYYIAAGADRIYVDKASIVGSIGVLMDGFGFTGLMEKLGVERRLMTAGTHKGSLDPFSPLVERDKAHAQAMLDEIHQQFIQAVRSGRGKRLKETPDTFSGLYWSGNKAVEMGLADGLGTVESVARDVIKEEDLMDYTQHENLPERMLKKFGASFGSGVGKSMVSQTTPRIH